MSWHCPECGDELVDVHFNIRAVGPIWHDPDDYYPPFGSLDRMAMDHADDDDGRNDAFSCSVPTCGWYGSIGHQDPDGASPVPYWVPDELARNYNPDPFIEAVKNRAAA